MKSIVLKMICVFTVLVLSTIGFNSEAKEKSKSDTTWNEWNFRINPYFWFMGFKGTIYRPPQPTLMPEPPPQKFDIDVGLKLSMIKLPPVKRA